MSGFAAAEAFVVGCGGWAAVGVELLGGDEAVAELSSKLGDGFDDDLLERGDQGHGVHVVEESEVGDTEDLALHLSLAVGDDGAEAGF